MKSICIISSLYPTALAPTHQVFVQKFVWALADLGIKCTVICPVAINQYPALAQLPYASEERTDNGALVDLYFPKYFTLGQRNLFGVKTARLTTAFYYAAVEKVWKRLSAQPEVVWGHFLTPAGITASRIGERYGIPAFAAYGESSPWSIYHYGKQRIGQEIQHLSGIAAVSSANYEDLKRVDVFPTAKIGVFPNGIKATNFYVRDKTLARTKFGFDHDEFIVAFVGQFSERKGVLRVAEAVKGLPGVRVAFAGKGPLKPQVANCIYMDTVKQVDMPYFLSAADVFVLPTLNEGCCNAIIEAMACGLPIISSNLPFNADILDYTHSFLVDPTNVEEIRSRIVYLQHKPALRKAMGKAAQEKARHFTIEARARKINEWMGVMTQSSRMLKAAI